MGVHVEEVDVVVVQVDDVEFVDVPTDVEEDVEVVVVQIEDVDMDDVEVVDVAMDEALAELEFADMLGVLQPHVDEEVGKYVVFIKNQNYRHHLYCSSDLFQW